MRHVVSIGPLVVVIATVDDSDMVATDKIKITSVMGVNPDIVSGFFTLS